MKPTHQHLRYGSGETKCGKTTRHDYVSDAFYRTLPQCKGCFEGFVSGIQEGEQIPNKLANIERIVLRDFL